MPKWLIACLAFASGLACAGPAPSAAPPPAGPAVSIDYSAGRVVRRSPAGLLLWATRVDDVDPGARRPAVAWDAARVFVACRGGVSALDARTGKEVWRSKGANDGLFLDGRLLLATGYGEERAKGEVPQWATARSTADGKEVFRVRLPSGYFGPLPIRRVAGLFLVRSDDFLSFDHESLLFDRTGAVKHRLDSGVVDGRRVGKDIVLLTDRDVVRLGGDGKKKWAAPFDDSRYMAGGELLELPGGDIVACLCGSLPHGVEVVRLDPATGKAAWHVSCNWGWLDFGHPAFWQKATLKVEKDRLRVTSRRSAGSFVEVLDLATGVRRSRIDRRK